MEGLQISTLVNEGDIVSLPSEKSFMSISVLVWRFARFGAAGHDREEWGEAIAHKSSIISKGGRASNWPNPTSSLGPKGS